MYLKRMSDLVHDLYHPLLLMMSPFCVKCPKTYAKLICSQQDWMSAILMGLNTYVLLVHIMAWNVL